MMRGTCPACNAVALGGLRTRAARGFWYTIARWHARLQELLHERFRVNLRGMRFLAQRIRQDIVLDVAGQQLLFDHRIAPTYGRLIAGRWNEPETHRLLDHVICGLRSTPLWFVDVGANVGEMVLDVARQPNVHTVVALEPVAEYADVIRWSAQANRWDHVTVHAWAAADRPGCLSLLVDGQQSRLLSGDLPVHRAVRLVPAVTLDDAVAKRLQGLGIVLVDVEGAELQVLAGAVGLIQRLRPLVILEYHARSRQRFSSDQLRRLLGRGYVLWRLRRDGRLDRHVERSWNCVAVPEDSPFSGVCQQLQVGADRSHR